MLGSLTRRVFGSSTDRVYKTYAKQVDAINALEPESSALSDEALRARTDEFRNRAAGGATLDELLPEAYATVREAAKRTLGQRHFDVQLIGGIVLHQGTIAEMKTGEGKTLAATLPVYLNALEGKGAHIVTVNDYLAQRDAAWMGEIYAFLGLTVGCIVHGMTDEERQVAYAADITYGTNNEFGFDYLRDNMKFSLDAMVQRPFNFAIVDEVDSILIDEARTPLIISGPTEDNSELYEQVDRLIPRLEEDDYEQDEKSRAVTLTDAGAEQMETLLQETGLIESPNLYDIENVSVVHHVNQALRAHKMFTRDTDYIVKDDKVVIIDEFTGRMMPGRRYSDGLHQALEAKERVSIQNENQTLASITFQNYFRLYPTLAGMTGTALTEAAEFADIYGLDVVDIPTNVPFIRIDHEDEVYRKAEEKFKVIVDVIEESQKKGQPVLVGTISIDKSERLSTMLRERHIEHNVLNARYHDKEAAIIAQAGRLGSVTIATNMAGRGTDIQLGGNAEVRCQTELAEMETDPEHGAAVAKINAEVAAEREKVVAAGGLYVMATERHEARRIDNQLRGRSGRQGDPGASTFFLSLEDDLMRIFGSERIDSMLGKLGVEEGEAIVHPWVSKALEKAQKKVEESNFEVRKNLLKFDDVMNDQRKVIYEQRIELMQADDVAETLADMRAEFVDNMIERAIPPKAYPEEWDIEGLHEESQRVLGLDLPVAEWATEDGIAEAEMHTRISDALEARMSEKVERYGPEIMRLAEKSLLLQILDRQWKDHLLSLDHLRQGISLRAYGQRDPLNEYKREAFDMFEGMLANLRERVTTVMSHLELRVSSPDEIPTERPAQEAHESREDPALAGTGDAPPPALEGGGLVPGMMPVPVPAAPGGHAAADHPSTVRNPELDPNDPATWGKTGRNVACPCGSGKKYKHCHGKMV